jgi:hypothetical protein
MSKLKVCARASHHRYPRVVDVSQRVRPFRLHRCQVGRPPHLPLRPPPPVHLGPSPTFKAPKSPSSPPSVTRSPASPEAVPCKDSSRDHDCSSAKTQPLSGQELDNTNTLAVLGSVALILLSGAIIYGLIRLRRARMHSPRPATLEISSGGITSAANSSDGHIRELAFELAESSGVAVVSSTQK